MAVPDQFQSGDDAGDPGSVTHWIAQMRLGNATAAQELWERYYGRLVRLAQTRLNGARLRAADEEDVVQSAFATFCGRIENGQFPILRDRDDLWRLLVVITARKAISYIRREKAQKRGGAVLEDAEAALDEAVGNEPSPELALQTTETLRELLAELPLDSWRDVALTKMEGLTNEEVAERLACSVRTVERRLGEIRKLWQTKLDGIK